MPIKDLPITAAANINTEEVGLSTHGATMVNFFVDSNNNVCRWPGLIELCDLRTAKGIDGLFWWQRQGIAIAISDGKTFKITDSLGTKTEITGDEFNNGQIVSFAAWDTSIYAANGGQIVEIPSSGTTAYISDADAPTTVSWVAEIDKYLVANEDGTERFWWSEVSLPEDWQANFASAEAKFDLLKCLRGSGSELYLWGSKTIELWTTTGSTTIPFARELQGFVDSGIGAEFSPAFCYGRWCFLDNLGQVVSFAGREPQIFSQTLNTYIQNNFGVISDAVGDRVIFGGNEFYLLSFPTEEKTIICDIQKGGWYEIAYWKTSQSIYQHYRARAACYSQEWNMSLIGDRLTGKIYRLDSNVHTDDSETQRSILRTPRIDHDYPENRKESRCLVIDMVRTGTPTDMDDVEILIKYRDNDETIWKNEHAIAMGSPGKTGLRKKIKNLGMYNNRQYEMVMLTDHPFAIRRVQEEFNILP